MKYIIIIIQTLLFVSCFGAQSPKIKKQPQTHSVIKVDSLAVVFKNRGNAKDDSGDKAGAIADYTKAIKISPTYDIAYFNRAIVKSDLGDNKDAITDYSKAIELNPQFAKAYYGRALEKSAIGDPKGEIADYRKAIEANDTYFSAYFNLGISLSEIGDSKSAAEVYAIALDKCEVNYNFFNNYGRILYDLRRFSEAVDVYSKGIELFPSDKGRMLYSRGLAKQQAGDKVGAAKDWIESYDQGCREALTLQSLANEYLKQ